MRNMKLLVSLVLTIGIVAFSCAGRTEAALPVETISVPVISDMKSYEIPDNEALALIKDMKCGWNLGNTFDSFDGYTAHSEESFRLTWNRFDRYILSALNPSFNPGNRKTHCRNRNCPI